MSERKINLYTDGGARGNPGPAAAGVVIKTDTGDLIESFGKFLGETTNNQAEYRALIFGLERAKEIGAAVVAVFMDSELVVNQLRGEFKVKDKDLAPLFVKVWNLSLSFKKITYQHIRRAENKLADAEVNKVLDQLSKF
jgi:ribonuclease HI